jgi:transcription termination factor NusB
MKLSDNVNLGIGFSNLNKKKTYFIHRIQKINENIHEHEEIIRRINEKAIADIELVKASILRLKDCKNNYDIDINEIDNQVAIIQDQMGTKDGKCAPFKLFGGYT